MTTFLVALSILLIIAVAVILIISKKRNRGKIVNEELSESPCDEEYSLQPVIDEVEDGLTIPIELLPSNIEIDESSLFEIKDMSVIARISENIPQAAETLSKTLHNKALKNVELYKVIIPKGEKLVKSKQMEDAFRAFTRNTKRISSQANLVKVDPSKISKASTLANGVANIMNVGSLVVGQYYMSEVNSKLEILNDNVSKISDFQEREYKSKVLSLIALVKEISQFSSEILESEDLRRRKLFAIENLKKSGAELLQQANLSITEIAEKNPNPSYVEYQSKIEEFTMRLKYQQVIVSVLEEISQLTNVLGKGDASSELSYSLFNGYLEQSIKVRRSLQKWHNAQIRTHGIELDKNRRDKKGVEAFLSMPLGLLNDNWNYKAIEDGLANKINAQIQEQVIVLENHEELYDEDVEIIIKDGKYYYLPVRANTSIIMQEKS